MAELKCPWQTVETVVIARDDARTERKVQFADCVEKACPFWMHGKYTASVCYRAMREVGRD